MACLAFWLAYNCGIYCILDRLTMHSHQIDCCCMGSSFSIFSKLSECLDFACFWIISFFVLLLWFFNLNPECLRSTTYVCFTLTLYQRHMMLVISYSFSVNHGGSAFNDISLFTTHIEIEKKNIVISFMRKSVRKFVRRRMMEIKIVEEMSWKINFYQEFVIFF